jgi:hypothetical protein
MSDTKISALTSATTPLAGTEVLPIVQSSTTVKVAVNDLTVRNIRAAATTGILQVSGPTAGTTRTVTVPDANFTAARTDAAQSFTGDQTLSTGNLIQGTAAKGINFTANTPAAGMTSQLLNWYEQGTFTATLTCGTSGTITLNSSQNTLSYTRVGRVVTVTGYISVSSVSTPLGRLTLNGLPFTCANGLQYQAAMTVYAASLTTTAITAIQGRVTNNSTTATIDNFSTGDSTFDLANKVQAGSNFAFSFSYFAA